MARAYDGGEMNWRQFLFPRIPWMLIYPWFLILQLVIWGLWWGFLLTCIPIAIVVMVVVEGVKLAVRSAKSSRRSRVRRQRSTAYDRELAARLAEYQNSAI
jgi:hypothetical protein